jgi:hypothetical protein
LPYTEKSPSVEDPRPANRLPFYDCCRLAEDVTQYFN